MRFRRAVFGLILAGLALPASAPVTAQDADPAIWPQWRGPDRDGLVEGMWPDAISGDRLTPLWRVELGPSYSTPIVAEDRVFVTETQNEQTEVVRALRRDSGEEIWSAEWEGSIRVPFFAASNGSWIRATPAYDGERLYVAGMRDLLVCLDAENGDILWSVDFVAELGAPVPDFGFVSSPLIQGDALYVQAGASLVKLDKLTGDVVWRSMEDGGGMFGSAFSSPTMATIAGSPQLLVQSRSHLAGVSPEDGQILWRREIEAFRGMNILTPTVTDHGIFTSAYGGKSHLFDPESTPGGWSLSQSWENKVQGYMSTPVVVDGYIYLHLRNQRFVCLNAETGEQQWITRPYGKYWSLVSNGEKILALDERGELLLIAANPEEFTLLDRREVASDSWAHLVVCGNEVYVRELDALAVYRWE